MSLLLQEWGRHTGELWGSVAEKTRGFYMVLRVAELQLKALCRILTGGASLTHPGLPSVWILGNLVYSGTFGHQWMTGMPGSKKC